MMRVTGWFRELVPSVAASGLLFVSTPALASDTLMFVMEWPVEEGTHVIAVFDDGAGYHALAPHDWNAPDACRNPQRISLTLLTSYDYASLRSKNKPDIQLDPQELARHWRAMTKPVEYDKKAEATIHANVTCTFAVMNKPNDRLTSLRLMKYKSLFFEVQPQAADQLAASSWFWQATSTFARQVTTPQRD